MKPLLIGIAILLTIPFITKCVLDNDNSDKNTCVNQDDCLEGFTCTSGICLPLSNNSDMAIEPDGISLDSGLETDIYAFADLPYDTIPVGTEPTFSFGDPNSTEPVTAVAIDQSGNIYIAGMFYGETILGGTTLPKTGPKDAGQAFVTKLSPSGQILWANSTTGSQDNVYISDISVDATGSVTISGQFHCVGNISTGAPYFGIFQTYCASYDMVSFNTFVAKLTPNGVFKWVSSPIAFSGRVFGIAHSTDKNGNIYFTGNLTGDMVLSPFNLQAAYGIFLTKLTPDGKPLWLKMPVGDGNTKYPAAVKVGNSDNIYLAGELFPSNDSFVAKISPSDGSVLWKKDLGGCNTSNEIKGIAIDTNENVYVTGNYYLTSTFGTTTLTTPGSGLGTTAYVSKLSSNGQFLFSKNMCVPEGPCDESLEFTIQRFISMGAGNTLFITGVFIKNTVFDSLTIKPQGTDKNIFVAKMSSSGQFASVVSAYSNTAIELGAMTTYNNGNPIVVGSFNGTATFGNTTLQASTTESDLFVWRFSMP